MVVKNKGDAGLIFYCCITNYQKLPACNKINLLSHRFRWKGVQAWFSWILFSGSCQKVIKVLSMAVISFDSVGPLPSSLIVGRIQLHYYVVGMRSLFLKAIHGSLHNITMCFFKANPRLLLLIHFVSHF